MPQPVISGTPPTLRFGNAPLPNGQGTMANLNLNDGSVWQWQSFAGDDDYVQVAVGQLAWRAASVVLGRDRKARTLALPMRYQEATTAPGAALGVQTALMEQAGPQQITFDNATFIGAEFAGLKRRTMLKKFAPYYWSFELEFFCPVPYFSDLSATVVAPVTLTSGTATNFNVTYLGSVFTRPVWTLTIPVGNAVAIQSFRLQNVMNGDDLTVTFPSPLPASTAATVTIDSGAMSVVDGNGVAYDVAGTAFPLLYPPAGQVQQIRGTLTPVSGTATGCTIGASYTPRWLL
jgi:hypothetical protein